ncbi:hypothetical protein OG394_00500 [Kribbella sp. NBC_01245]|uniref:hypothetical protein n=1 Tax=Kribbella sp. NBC_01245 TaxID=2903578 RepID=UPI002E29ABAD|nr:hypothetical protein [Kribbella sp. NBC_01245]
MADIIIRLHDGAPKPEHLLGFDVLPLFPDAREQELDSWFAIRLPDDQNADEVVRALTQTPEVATAYVKPPESAP